MSSGTEGHWDELSREYGSRIGTLHQGRLANHSGVGQAILGFLTERAHNHYMIVKFANGTSE
jgi:hypothetical protein